MKQFLDKDFLLNTEAAKILYHEAAEKQPIIDKALGELKLAHPKKGLFF